jgi:hypothetical protein
LKKTRTCVKFVKTLALLTDIKKMPVTVTHVFR